jgi:hypothetical protein
MKITDFYGERIRSKRHGEGILTKVSGTDVHVKYDNGQSWFYEENAFKRGTLEFLKPELLEPFNKAYDEYILTMESRMDDFTKWLMRD